MTVEMRGLKAGKNVEGLAACQAAGDKLCVTSIEGYF